MRDELENNEVAVLLQTLPQVDAPKDFDFKVRSRIAAGRPAPSGMPMWVKAAVPLVLILAVVGYFGLRSSITQPTPNAPTVAAISQDAPQTEAPVVVSSQTQPTDIATPNSKPSNTTLATVKKPVNKTVVQGGSVDQAVNVGKQIDLDERSAVDAFALAGVKGSVDASGLKVDAASSNSGLKPGDVVESVDGQDVTNKTKIKGRVSGKTVRVRRDGKMIDVVIKN